jgi:hypothetical protein
LLPETGNYDGCACGFFNTQLVSNGTVLLVCHSLTIVERANLLLDTISLRKLQVSITENGLYVPGERLLVEDNSFSIRGGQESPRILPSEINNNRVLQYAALLQHLRHTALNMTPIKDVSTKQHNALAYAAFKDCIPESHALMGCRCIRSEMNSKVLPRLSPKCNTRG